MVRSCMLVVLAMGHEVRFEGILISHRLDP